MPMLGPKLAPLLLAASLAACGSTPALQPGQNGSSTEVDWIPVEPDVSLYVERAGSGPTVILIEGAQMDLRQWDETFAALSEEFDVIRYDVRGFGRSDWADHPYQHHVDLWTLMEELDVESAHLVGLSLGGRIAIDLALEAPQRVRSLVLSGPGLSGFRFDTESFAAISEARSSNQPHLVSKAWLQHGYLAPAMENPALAPRLEELALDNADTWLRSDPEQPLSPPAIVRLEELSVPTLLLVGERDEPDIHSIAEMLEAGIETLTRVDAPDAGHLLPMERPDWFQTQTADFLRQIEAGS